MSEFKNVTVVKKANIYFDGKVTSRTLLFPDGSKKRSALCSRGNTNSVRRAKNGWRYLWVIWKFFCPERIDGRRSKGETPLRSQPIPNST